MSNVKDKFAFFSHLCVERQNPKKRAGEDVETQMAAGNSSLSPDGLPFDEEETPNKENQRLFANLNAQEFALQIIKYRLEEEEMQDPEYNLLIE
jgi:hypothetical protein